MQVSWREAALICSWLHNGRSNDANTLFYGAYDVSTWGYRTLNGQISLTDQSHVPGAQYWIPSLDEWMKAAFWDERRTAADGTPGDWALYSYGDGNGGPLDFHYRGLQRIADGQQEWTDTPYVDEFSGITAGMFNHDYLPRRIHDFGFQDVLRVSGSYVRFATVPSPGSSVALILIGVVVSVRRRRSVSCGVSSVVVRSGGCLYVSFAVLVVRGRCIGVRCVGREPTGHRADVPLCW
jgi:hypothetical protein